MLDTSTHALTDTSTDDPDQHLYLNTGPCWVVHRPDQDVHDELPHYSTQAAADRAATEGDWWWDSELAAGTVLAVDLFTSRCLAARCAECGADLDDESYHYATWDELAEQARYATGERLDHAWQIDHDHHRLWCGGCKVTRRTPTDHVDTFGLWMGPQTRCHTVDVTHLLIDHRIVLSPDAMAAVTAMTTLNPDDRTATVHTDQGDYIVALPCVASRVL